MKLKLFKARKSSKNNDSNPTGINSKLNSINDIVFTCKIIHTGEVLDKDFILKNRSSKYNFLSF